MQPDTAAKLKLRAATREDVPLIRALVRELAEYEREPESAIATEADLLEEGFGPNAVYRTLVAEWEGEAVGFALYFYNFSTWRGRRGIYLEDLFVRPSHRGFGIGKALLVRLAQIAVEERCYGMRWQVLDWNDPAIRFYESLGAEFLDEWRTMRLMDEPLRRLAGK